MNAPQQRCVFTQELRQTIAAVVSEYLLVHYRPVDVPNATRQVATIYDQVLESRHVLHCRFDSYNVVRYSNDLGHLGGLIKRLRAYHAVEAFLFDLEAALWRQADMENTFEIDSLVNVIVAKVSALEYELYNYNMDNYPSSEWDFNPILGAGAIEGNLQKLHKRLNEVLAA